MVVSVYQRTTMPKQYSVQYSTTWLPFSAGNILWVVVHTLKRQKLGMNANLYTKPSMQGIDLLW